MSRRGFLTIVGIASATTIWAEVPAAASRTRPR
jgi:hypothetical protein